MGFLQLFKHCVIFDVECKWWTVRHYCVVSSLRHASDMSEMEAPLFFDFLVLLVVT